ncbi:hypothetical protein [Candidatus Ferrigenium straubiae]|jgi:hypothetical protein|uniref:hypothetical protein n=1 Tax=Candidatus Ferrigenium straubiae TaxID=2919506 RepID=UPI003F4A8F6E
MQANKFEVAKKLAGAAFVLDNTRCEWPDEDQAALLHLVVLMHNTAERLVCFRKDEMHRMIAGAAL